MARDQLYAPSHWQESIYHGLCYISCRTLAGSGDTSINEQTFYHSCLSLLLAMETYKPVIIKEWTIRRTLDTILVQTLEKAISHSIQCSTSGVTKVVVCTTLCVGWSIQKIPCCYSERTTFEVATAGFLSLSEWFLTISLTPSNH